jgi:serpin B
VDLDFLISDLKEYPYIRTDEFEAVELHALQASILLVLPSDTSDIGQLENRIASKPELVEGILPSTLGDVRMPPFHFTFDADLRASIETLGVHRIFSELRSLLPMAPAKEGGIVTGIAQKTEITVDQTGIRADSGTVVSGLLGGLMGYPQEPFHMILDRPFLFLIRDTQTRALLFAGAVTDPAR